MIGRLRHRITLQKLQITTDSIGQETEKWVDVAYVTGITSQMRIVALKHTYIILSVINFEEKNRYLQLMCSERGDK